MAHLLQKVIYKLRGVKVSMLTNTNPQKTIGRLKWLHEMTIFMTHLSSIMIFRLVNCKQRIDFGHTCHRMTSLRQTHFSNTQLKLNSFFLDTAHLFAHGTSSL